MRPLAFLALLALSVGCADEPGPSGGLLGADPLTATTVSALDSLVGQQVSVNGRVVDQRAGERTLVLDDGTGLVHVETPEPLPILVGERLFVQGRLREADGRPVLDADEWLYDSTAVSFRSE